MRRAANAHHLAGRDVHVNVEQPVALGTAGALAALRTAAPADFGTARFLGLSLLPAAAVARLKTEPTGLYELLWRRAWERGELDLVEHRGVAFDVGTPGPAARGQPVRRGRRQRRPPEC